MPSNRKTATNTSPVKKRGRKVFAKEFRGYSDDQLRAVAAAGGGLPDSASLENLKEALETAIAQASIHGGIRTIQKTKRASASDFARVAKLADKILETLNVPIDGEPYVTWKYRGGLEHQGREWARRWYKAAEREARVSTLRRARAEVLRKQGKAKEAQEYLDKVRARRVTRERTREKWRALHGMWPEKTVLDWVQTTEGDRMRLWGEDLALYAAVRGIQTLRTWAELESKRQTAMPTPEDVPMVLGRMLKGEAKLYLIGEFAKVYAKFFDKRFGISKLATDTADGRKAGTIIGPGVPFMQASLAPIGIEMEPEAIHKAWRTYRQLVKGESASRK